ncbi:charged multivesicular body protein 1a-like [Artemia franciscana]|uniref:Chromatin-modifying protein 1a n=1 Tax=Artemia franciscana TaxID=6661 RepID=A0AA88IF35_ARTSF|nr:hypothetical protein QYM36_001720 [Artemia franciscana]
MDDTSFQLRFCAKQLEKMSKKSEKDKAVQQSKCKKALQQGNIEGARIYAENAIRKKNEALNYLRMSSKVDAVQSKVHSAAMLRGLTKNMGQVVRSLDKAIGSMDLEKISATMDKFEKQFEDLDVKTSVVEDAIGATTTLSTPADEVEALMQRIADEAQLDLAGKLAVSSTVPSVLEEERGQADLDRRLAALRE